MILKHYLLRTVKDPLNLGMLILFPLAMIFVFTFTATSQIDEVFRTINGYCVIATGNLMFNVFFFQYFSGMIVTDFLYNEFRTDMRWRLMATPKSFNSFIFAAIGASIIVSFFNGAVVFVFARFVLNAYFDIVMTSLALIVLATFVTLFGVMCFLIFPKKGTTTAVIMVFAFAQMLMLNFNMIPFPEFGEIGPASFLPVVAAARVAEYAGDMSVRLINPEIGWEAGFDMLGYDMRASFTSLGILVGLTVIVGIVVLVLGRKRKI